VQCRYSDTAFSYKYGGVSASLGYVARPTTVGSITINHSNPTFRVIGKRTPTTGLAVDKVGRVTGWTKGIVISTCRYQPQRRLSDHLCIQSQH